MRKVEIKKVGASTIVRTYDTKGDSDILKQGSESILVFNKSTNISVVSNTEVISVISTDHTLIFTFDEAVEKYGATNIQEYVEALCENLMFTEAVGV